MRRSRLALLSALAFAVSGCALPQAAGDPANQALLTIALATAIGMLAQVIGAWTRIPPIVLLLGFGVLFGPSGLGWVNPNAIGPGLTVLVKLAVAIILFDGALNLRLDDLRRSAREVRQLVSVGVLITATLATLAAWLIAGLRWQTAMLFGTLVSVTGPTVVQPLLKRIELPRRVRALLEGEAILIDPIGAILAVTLFEVLLDLQVARPGGLLEGMVAYVSRIAVGILVGVTAGIAMSVLLRLRRAVPEELGNLVALAGVWGAFAVAEALLPEAGIMAAVAMGLAIQRDAIPGEHRLRRFKEQLTVLGVSLLFVLLAANLPVQLLRAEGWRGVITVLVLMFVVRPLVVAVSLRGSAFTARERIFVAWVGPRGIVAASVASLFALRLEALGLPDGDRLLALTFLTIAMTVTIQGLTAPLAARALALQMTGGKPVVVVGGGPLGLSLAKLLADAGRPVAVVDRNLAYVWRARRAGLPAVVGNALDESVLAEAGADDAELFIATTSNSEVNAIAAQLARDRFGIPQAFTALANPDRGATEALLRQSGARLAFGRPVEVRQWDAAIDSGGVELKWITLPQGWQARALSDLVVTDAVLPIARRRGENVEVAFGEQRLASGDSVAVLTRLGTAAEVLSRLTNMEQPAAS